MEFQMSISIIGIAAVIFGALVLCMIGYFVIAALMSGKNNDRS